MTGKGMRGLAQKAANTLNRAREWMMDYAYLVTLGAVIAIIAASALYTRHVQKDAGDSGIQAAADAPEIREASESTPSPLESASPLPTLAPITPLRVTSVSGAGSVWPVSGEILREFDASTPVFWEALGCWQVHAGLDIAGEADEEVRCARDGVVRQAVRDELWGWRVQVEQTDGRLAEYAGLALCEVDAGQSVTRGQSLGTLMEHIPCEAELGPHLHMTLMLDGRAVDPLSIMPE